MLLFQVLLDGEETSSQFLGNCPAAMMLQYSIMAAYYLLAVELGTVEPSNLLQFARASIRFHRGCALG